MQSPSQLTTHKKVGAPNKLVIGFLVATATAIIGMSGVAGAQASTPDGGGYGGSGNVHVNLNVNGNNNNITVIINYFFGS